MTAKTTVCAAVAVLASAFASVAVAGVAYDTENTNAWFSVNAAEANLTDTTVWTKPTSGTAEVDSANDVIAIDTDLDDPLKYTPTSESGAVALVNAHVIVSPNAETPETNSLGGVQAALTTVTNETNSCIDWYGLVRGDENGPQWVQLSGNTPVSGATYDIVIALDNREGYKKIRYSVKASDATAYTDLTNNSKSWLDNPESGKTSVASVSFAGTGSVGDFSGDTIADAVIPVTTIDSVGEIAGFDFTGGSITAAVSVTSGSVAGKTATLSVVDFATGSAVSYDAGTVAADGTVSWDLAVANKIAALTPGGTYSYTITVDGATASGTFTAANWGADGSWFSAKVENGEAVTNNGTWANTYLVPAPEIDTDSNTWSIYGDASFEVADGTPGEGVVSRVDTKYSFETFVAESALALQDLDGAVSAVVAATNTSGVASWYAYTGSGTWSALAGGATPEVGTSYILRAEFDFKSATKRVRYQLSTDDGASFAPMTYNGAQWIALVNQEKTTLSEVAISGKGALTSIYAEVSDRSVAKDHNTGTKYDTLWDAINAGTSSGVFDLLTNATLSPSALAGRMKFKINANGYEFKYDNTNSAGWWMYKKGDYWHLMKTGGTHIFK